MKHFILILFLFLGRMNLLGQEICDNKILNPLSILDYFAKRDSEGNFFKHVIRTMEFKDKKKSIIVPIDKYTYSKRGLLIRYDNYDNDDNISIPYFILLKWMNDTLVRCKTYYSVKGNPEGEHSYSDKDGSMQYNLGHYSHKKYFYTLNLVHFKDKKMTQIDCFTQKDSLFQKCINPWSLLIDSSINVDTVSKYTYSKDSLILKKEFYQSAKLINTTYYFYNKNNRLIRTYDYGFTKRETMFYNNRIVTTTIRPEAIDALQHHYAIIQEYLNGREIRTTFLTLESGNKYHYHIKYY